MRRAIKWYLKNKQALPLAIECILKVLCRHIRVCCVFFNIVNPVYVRVDFIFFWPTFCFLVIYFVHRFVILISILFFCVNACVCVCLAAAAGSVSADGEHA